VPLDPHDTIVALSSPAGPGARAIVRLTGPQAWEVPRLGFSSQPPLPERIRRGCWPGTLVLPELHSPLPVELLAWPAPRTFTGQDLVEIHTLSSPPLVEALIALLLRRGTRAAQPGEFTLRAFLAGKLDLTQAEAVVGVVEADQVEDLKTALAQLAGNLARPLNGLRDELLGLLAEVEANLDFAHEDLTFISTAEMQGRQRSTRDRLHQVQQQLERRGLSGRPFRVVLVGPPNAGKSSLFNALAGRPAALVSPEAGTTRDFLTHRLIIEDVEIELVDTAGREEAAASPGAETITAQAQAARRRQMEQADLLLECVAAGTAPLPLSPPGSGAAPVLPVWTKCDLVTDGSLTEPWPRTSATRQEGLVPLRALLAGHARSSRRSAVLAPSWSRCRHHVAACLEHLEQAGTILAQEEPLELLALELRLAVEQLGEMVGAVYTEDLLDRIFSQFCIGK
jgi:tRNA modification GTPase